MSNLMNPIVTPRLELHAVTVADYAILAVDRSDPAWWTAHGLTNPAGHLVADPGPLPFRIPRIAKDPDLAPLLIRLAADRQTREIVGSAGFHDRPDADGMIEIGLGVEPAYRGQGFAQEMLLGMWGWIVDQPDVRMLRYTVSPDNEPSQAIIRKFGFAYRGQQIDEEDGPEDIYEMETEEFRNRHLNR